jgi:hypothetical protein
MLALPVKSRQLFHITNAISSRRALYLAIAAGRPQAWMRYSAIANHVYVNIGYATGEILTGIYGCDIIAVFPESPGSLFALVKLLAGSAGDQLHALGNSIAAAIIEQKMNMICQLPYNPARTGCSVSWPQTTSIAIVDGHVRSPVETPAYGSDA